MSINYDLRPVTGVQSYNCVWDANSNTWQPMSQPGGSGGGTVDQGTAGASPWLIAGAVTGPVTDAQIRATPLPVSGTVGVSGSVAVTGSFYQNTQPVSLASAPTTPVTGTFWQNTQPVSGPLTDTQIRATPLPVSGTVSTGGLTDTQIRATPLPVSGTVAVTGAYQTTQPVSGTFWQSTQPVSIATAPVLVAGSAIIGNVRIDQTTPGTTNGVQVNAALPAGTNAIGKLAANSGVIIGDVNVVAVPTLTKGTQGSTGFSTQDLKDAGRTSIIFSAVAAASGSTGTETAISLTKAAGTGATSSANSFVVTSGKRFRITQLLVSAVGHATGTTQATTFALRLNASGAVTTTSTPVLWKGRAQTPATSLAYQQIAFAIPDGYEILGDGTLQIGMTANAVFSTNAPTWDVTIVGFEY